MQRRLDTLASIAVVVLCCLALFQVGLRLWASSPGGQIAGRLQSGDALTVPGVHWEKSARTLVLAIRLRCSYCVASLPFYRVLTSQRDVRRSNIRIVVASSDELPEVSQYLSASGVRVDQVVHLPLRDLRIRGTPTLIAVGQSGRVEGVWEGQLEKSDESRVLDILLAER